MLEPTTTHHMAIQAVVTHEQRVVAAPTHSTCCPHPKLTSGASLWNWNTRYISPWKTIAAQEPSPGMAITAAFIYIHGPISCRYSWTNQLQELLTTFMATEIISLINTLMCIRVLACGMNAVWTTPSSAKWPIRLQGLAHCSHNIHHILQ